MLRRSLSSRAWRFDVDGAALRHDGDWGSAGLLFSAAAHLALAGADINTIFTSGFSGRIGRADGLPGSGHTCCESRKRFSPHTRLARFVSEIPRIKAPVNMDQNQPVDLHFARLADRPQDQSETRSDVLRFWTKSQNSSALSSAAGSCRFGTLDKRRAFGHNLSLVDAALHSIESFRRLALIGVFVCVAIASAVAKESKLYVLWDTVSPDGKYAIAWATTGEARLDELPPPSDTVNNPVANYVIEVASRKIVVPLAGGHYWNLYGGGHPNHFSLETVWSENSRSMLAIYNSRWSTDAVFLVDVLVPRAVRIENQLERLFKQTLKSARGSEYAKYKGSLEFTFGSPWFVAPGRFYVTANASVPKQENPDLDFGLYFRTANGGKTVNLVKFEPSSGEESVERSLNRTYRKLHGLLSAADQEALVEEERAWLIERDAITSEQQKEAFISARTQELQNRIESIVEAKEKQ
jgi:hypothetical protein